MSDKQTNVFGLMGLGLRAGAVYVGRQQSARNRRRLLFVLVTRDLSGNSLTEIQRDFAGLPILRAFTAAELEARLGLRNTKVLGFARTPLGRNIRQRLSDEGLAEDVSTDAEAMGKGNS